MVETEVSPIAAQMGGMVAQELGTAEKAPTLETDPAPDILEVYVDKRSSVAEAEAAMVEKVVMAGTLSSLDPPGM
tara:strand:+ start:354 stop:578 length:225 start_codon:yes stop_codon:yes gene_type:complete